MESRKEERAASEPVLLSRKGREKGNRLPMLLTACSEAREVGGAPGESLLGGFAHFVSLLGSEQ